METPFTYISAEDANTYLDDNLFAHAWINADAPTRLRSLRHATRIIDACVYKFASVSSAHAFPLVGQTSIPTEVAEACADIALNLLDGINPDEVIEELENIRHQIGPISVAKDPKLIALNIHRYLGLPSYRALQKLAPYLLLAPADGATMVRI